MFSSRTIQGDHHILPVELLDEILTTAVLSLDPSSVSSIALVSRTYRILANEARFSFLALSTNMRQIEKRDHQRLDNLADVLRSGKLVNTLPSIDAFITSFSLNTSGTAEELKLYLYNGSLELVFDNLFRQLVRSHRPRSDFRKLSLEICNWTQRQLVSPSGLEADKSNSEDEEEDEEETFLEWFLTGSPLTLSFIDLLVNSQVTHLHLGNIQNIPLNFLQGSKVGHLSFGDVSFSEPEEDEDRATKEPVCSLQSVYIGGLAKISFEIFVRLLCSQSVPMPNTFLFLTKVTFGLASTRHIEMLNETLNHATNLEYLSICPYGNPAAKDNDDWRILYDHLLRLRTIEFQISDGGASFPLVAKLLGNGVAPSLETFMVSCTETFNDENFERVKNYLGLYPFNFLDKQLSHRQPFKNLRNVVISFRVWIMSEYDPKDFDVDTYKENYQNYVTSRFPLCLKKKPALNIRVPVVIRMDYGNGSIEL